MTSRPIPLWPCHLLPLVDRFWLVLGVHPLFLFPSTIIPMTAVAGPRYHHLPLGPSLFFNVDRYPDTLQSTTTSCPISSCHFLLHLVGLTPLLCPPIIKKIHHSLRWIFSYSPSTPIFNSSPTPTVSIPLSPSCHRHLLPITVSLLAPPHTFAINSPAYF